MHCAATGLERRLKPGRYGPAANPRKAYLAVIAGPEAAFGQAAPMAIMVNGRIPIQRPRISAPFAPALTGDRRRPLRPGW